MTTPTCALCDAERATDGVAANDPAALAWVREREPGGDDRWICPVCARRHLRDIEAKLAPGWWDPVA